VLILPAPEMALAGWLDAANSSRWSSPTISTTSGAKRLKSSRSRASDASHRCQLSCHTPIVVRAANLPSAASASSPNGRITPAWSYSSGFDRSWSARAAHICGGAASSTLC
jgi:hypothetical protein